MTKGKTEYETDVYTIRILAPQIFENFVKDKAILDVDGVRAVKKANMELANGKPYAFLAAIGEFSEVTKAAKTLLSSKELSVNTVAKALLIQSLSDRIMVNFYMKINKPIVKTKAFTDRKLAIEWLKKQVNTK